MTPNTDALPPLPGGIRLTVTERCELYDWRHESILIALDRAALAQRQQAAPSAQAEPVRRLHSFSSIDCEKLIAATVPGGSVCDPQEVADSIRRYLDAWPSAQPEPTRSQKMREAGFTARDNRLTCDECGAKFTAQFAPLHKCEGAAQPGQKTTAHERGCATCVLCYVDSHRCDDCYGQNGWKNWSPRANSQQEQP